MFCFVQVLELRGDSFQHFGNAAVVQSIVDRLPEIAREIAAPLARTEKVSLAVEARICCEFPLLVDSVGDASVGHGQAADQRQR